MSSRKTFLKNIGLALTGATFFTFESNAKDHSADISTRESKLDAELVKEFVKVSHSDFAMVKELHQQEPLLVYSSHDWGNGDFETGLEAAGHVGNKEIANFLIDKGARMNFFTLCMLGKFEIVSPLLKEFPALVNAKGPHGFTALHHANQGGEDAFKIKQLLESMGARDTQLEL